MVREKKVPVISARIRMLRSSEGLSQEEMGKIVGASKSSISEYENGDTRIKIDKLEKYAKHFHVDLNYLTASEKSDPQSAVPLFSSRETAVILGYRHKSPREQRIIRLQAMTDEEYDELYGNEEDKPTQSLLSDKQEKGYSTKDDKSRKKK